MNLAKMLKDPAGNLGTLWIWIGIALLLVNIFIVGIGSWEFWYGLTYCLGWIGLGIVLSIPKARVLSALCSTLGAFLGVMLVLQPWGYATSISAEIAGGLSVLLFAGVVLSESNVVKFGGYHSEAKYITLLALGASTLFGCIYLYNRITFGWAPFNYQTVMYLGGITLLSGFDFVTVLGAVKVGAASKIRLGLAAMAIFGAILLTGVLGWGLTLT